MTPEASAATTATLRQLVTPFARADDRKAYWQVMTTLPPFALLWVLVATTLEWSGGWSLLLVLPLAGLYVRLFIIQHDCGHGSFFASARLNRAVGAVLGLITFFPFAYWRKTHAIHHGTSGNLDRRGRRHARLHAVEGVVRPVGAGQPVIGPGVLLDATHFGFSPQVRDAIKRRRFGRLQRLAGGRA